jgi:hypothetical protein
MITHSRRIMNHTVIVQNAPTTLDNHILHTIYDGFGRAASVQDDICFRPLCQNEENACKENEETWKDMHLETADFLFFLCRCVMRDGIESRVF